MGGFMIYRCIVIRFPFRSFAQGPQLAAAVCALVLLLAACGGSGSDSATEIADTDPQVTASPVPTEPPPTRTPVEIATSAPAPTPTATPAPLTTPVPLEAPTPSSILLTTAFTNSSRVTTVGIDEVFFGMKPADAAVAASTQWVELESGSGNCYRITPSNGPEGVTLWVVDGFIERLDIEHPDIRTPSKLGLGNSVEELRSQIGDRLTIETNGDGSQTAVFAPTDPGDRDFRLIFELEDDKVVRYRSGRIGIVDRAEQTC